MPYELSRSGPQTWNIALNLEYQDTRFVANRFPSGFFSRNFVNWREKKKGLRSFVSRRVALEGRRGVLQFTCGWGGGVNMLFLGALSQTAAHCLMA